MTDKSRYRKGYAKYWGHHGEILQGVFRDQDAVLQRALITLPCSLYYSNGVFIHNKSGRLTVKPKYKEKALKGIKEVSEYLGMEITGGELQLYSNIPRSQGFGSSTADVCAAISAYANSVYTKINENEIALLAVQAEKASDSIMFKKNRVLFCQRTGIVLENYGVPDMAFQVLGFNTGDKRGINTLKMKLPDYSAEEIFKFEKLLAQYKQAVKKRNFKLIGTVALESAIINQKYMPKRNFDKLIEIANQTGAEGVQCAHSGNAAGILFRAEKESEAKIAECRNRLEGLGYKEIWQFYTKI